MRDERTLTHLLDGMDNASDGETVSVRDLLDEFGDRSITPFILMIALLLVSPLSAIPGVPSIAALIIITLSAQALWGRSRMWLPAFLLNREIASQRLRKAVDWMRRPCAFVDRNSHRRLQFLTVGPMRWVTLLVLTIIPMGWPLLEVLPMVSSIGAVTVSLLAFGLFTRDGLFVVLGYFVVATTLFLGLIVLF